MGNLEECEKDTRKWVEPIRERKHGRAILQPLQGPAGPRHFQSQILQHSPKNPHRLFFRPNLLSPPQNRDFRSPNPRMVHCDFHNPIHPRQVPTLPIDSTNKDRRLSLHDIQKTKVYRNQTQSAPKNPSPKW